MTNFNFNKWNTILGWITFAIALTTYTLTVEPTMSFWDCGEYIATAAKLEVGHPPGAPLFMVLGRLFTFFADPTDVAVWINRLSAWCKCTVYIKYKFIHKLSSSFVFKHLQQN